MKLVLLSDTHEKHNLVDVPMGDVLIHAGDFSMMGEPDKIDDFITWFGKQPHKYKICIAGNHDLTLDREFAVKNAWAAKWQPIRRIEC